MVTAINAVKLAGWLAAGLGYFLGLGWLASGPLLCGGLFLRKKNYPFLQLLPLTLVSGLVINYALQVCLPSMHISAIAGLGLAILGLASFTAALLRSPRPIKTEPNTVIGWIGAGFICLIFLVPMIAIPLQEWDARSIWFFHAKMIYYAGSTGLSAGWQDPSIIFSHTDYPILVPALAAQIASAAGYWNEYLPKLALFFMLVPAVLWLFSFTNRSMSFLLLLLVIPFGFYSWMWSGYMDGILALYFAVAMLLLGRFLQSRQAIDGVASVSCLILLIYVKNEGALAALTGLSLAAMLSFWQFKPLKLKTLLRVNKKYLLAFVISLAPLIAWTFIKTTGNLSNDLEIGSNQSFIHIFDRLADGSYKLILRNGFLQVEGPLLLLGLAYFAARAWKKTIPKESLPALLAAAAYGTGMLLIYLLTPKDLVWHLNSSIGRTFLPVTGCLFIAVYYILLKIESG